MDTLVNETACTQILIYRGVVIHVSFIVSVFLLLIFSAIQRTKKEKRSVRYLVQCRELFSLIYPLDLYDNHDRLAYCLTFGAASTLVLNLIFGDYTNYLVKLNPPPWATILVGVGLTVEISIDFFPMFACITSKSALFSNAVGFFYALGWFVGFLMISVNCVQALPEGKGFAIIGPQLPALICFVLLMGYFFISFFRVAINRYHGIKQMKEDKIMHTHQAEYVRTLLRKSKEKVYTGWRARVYKYYKPKAGFKYPTRVFMACTVCVIGLYQMSYVVIGYGLKIINDIVLTITNVAMVVLQQTNNTAAVDELTEKMGQVDRALVAAWYVTSVLAIILPCSYIPFMLINYRKHLLGMFSGNYNIPDEVKNMSSVPAIVGSLKYIGFQIGIFLVGYIFIQLIIYLLLCIIAGVVIASMWFFEDFFIKEIVELLLPAMIVGVGLMVSQSVCVMLFFVQEKHYPTDLDRPLAIRHRVWFLIFSYVAIFFNSLYALVMGMIRLIIGLVLAVVFLARIDKPLFMSGHVSKDIAYMVYVGNMYSENAHSHPVLVTFCHLLIFDILKPQRYRRQLKKHKQKQLIHQNSYTDIMDTAKDITGTNADVPDTTVKLSKGFRWHLAYTLINNPSLIELRKRCAVQPDEELIITDGQVHRISSKDHKDSTLKLMPHMVQVIKRHQLDKKRSNPEMEVHIPHQDRPKLNTRRSSGLIQPIETIMIQQQQQQQKQQQQLQHHKQPVSSLAVLPSIQADGESASPEFLQNDSFA